MSVLFKSIFVLINLFSVILAKQHVPVLFWSPSVSLPPVPTLKQLSSLGFSEILQDALGTPRPLIAVFLEKHLSSEDFNLRTSRGENLYDDLKNTIQNSSMQYLPSVVKPMDGVKQLLDDGYELFDYDGEIPLVMNKDTIVVVDLADISAKRADDLTAHFQTIQEIYSKLVKAHPNMLALYTGTYNNWAQKSIKRVRREDAPSEPAPVLIRAGNFVALANKISYKKDATSDFVDLNTVVSASLTNGSDPETSHLEVEFNDMIKLTFVFNGTSESWQWYISSIIHSNGKLVPSTEIWAPRSWSWHCAQELSFAASVQDISSTDKAVVNMTGFQAQPYLNEADLKFGQAIDCVPYFSIAIWTGFVVVVLMLFILTCGLLMIMDINNNDRFDDPKGKTITIPTSE